MLEQAATSKGVSLSEEIEQRLLASFRFEDEREAQLKQFGRPATRGIFELFAMIIRSVEFGTGKSWLEDPWVFDQACKGFAYLLFELRPPGKVVVPGFRRRDKWADQAGEASARGVLSQLDTADARQVLRDTVGADGVAHCYGVHMKAMSRIKTDLAAVTARARKKK
jgi:hypothetical protein